MKSTEIKKEVPHMELFSQIDKACWTSNPLEHFYDFDLIDEKVLVDYVDSVDTWDAPLVDQIMNYLAYRHDVDPDQPWVSIEDYWEAIKSARR